jgi:NADPH:quinone reductase-like Zn-dependent oxidoreductase
VQAVYFNKHGDLSSLRYGDLPDPEPGQGEVLIKLEAAALNRLDLWVRAGWPGLQIEYPHIPGADGAGEIAALGPGVDGLSVGDRVVINANLSCGRCEFCITGFQNRCLDWGLLGETRGGTYAQYVAVPAENAHPLPTGFSAHKAAAASLAFHTAWHSLIVRGAVRPGETVLVVGASGGVNSASIQVARLVGATVYVVGSSSKKLALAESLGADYLVDRSEEENWSKTVYLLTGKKGVDVVVDNVGTTYPQSFRAARKGGRILTVGNTGGHQLEIDNRYIFGKHLSILGSTMGTRDDFATVMGLIFEGRLNPVIDRSYPLSDAQKAQARLEAGEQMGKITLSIP